MVIATVVEDPPTVRRKKCMKCIIHSRVKTRATIFDRLLKINVDVPYSRKFSRDPIFAEGKSAQISRSNFRRRTFAVAPPTMPTWPWLHNYNLCDRKRDVPIDNKLVRSREVP